MIGAHDICTAHAGRASWNLFAGPASVSRCRRRVEAQCTSALQLHHHVAEPQQDSSKQPVAAAAFEQQTVLEPPTPNTRVHAEAPAGRPHLPPADNTMQAAPHSSASGAAPRSHRRHTPRQAPPDLSDIPAQGVNDPLVLPPSPDMRAQRGRRHRKHLARPQWDTAGFVSPPTGTSRRNRDPDALLGAIQSSQTLLRLQAVIYRDARWLQPPHVLALLQKAVQFADTDPRFWFHPASSQQPHATSSWPQHPASIAQQSPWGSQAAQPALWQHPAHPSEEGSDSVPVSDWGMSDEELLPHDRHHHSHLQPAWPPPLDPQAEEASVMQLLGMVRRSALLAGRLAAQQPLDTVVGSRILTCLAKLGYADDTVVRQVLNAVQPNLSGSGSFVLSSLMWACAMLKVQPPAVWLHAWEAALAPHVARLTAQEVATSVYALGKLRLQPSHSFMSALCARSMQVMGQCRPCDLSNLCCGVATTQHQPCSNWMGSFLTASGLRLVEFQLKDLQRTLASLATLGMRPTGDWLDGFCARCQELLGDGLPQFRAPAAQLTVVNRLTTRQMASMTSALARLGCRPDMRWMDVCLGHARQDFKHADAVDLTRLLAALSALRYKPGEAWMQAYLAAVFRHFTTLGPELVVSLLQSLVLLNHRPTDIWLHDLVRKVQGRLHTYSGDQLGSLLFALARLRYRPNQEWLHAWETASHSALDSFSADGLASSVWALAQLQHQPAVSWLYSFVLAAYSRLDAFGAGQLGAVFESLPQIAPHPGWLDELVQICASESSPGAGRGLASISYDELDSAIEPVSAASSTWDDDGMAAGVVAPSTRPAPVAGGVSSGGSGGGLWYKIPANGETLDSSSEPMTLRIYGLSGEEEILPLTPVSGAPLAANGATLNGTPMAAGASVAAGVRSSGVQVQGLNGVQMAAAVPDMDLDVAGQQGLGGAPLVERVLNGQSVLQRPASAARVHSAPAMG